MTDRTIVYFTPAGVVEKLTERQLYQDLNKSCASLKMAIKDFRLLFDAYEAGEVTSEEAGLVVTGILDMYQPLEYRH